MGRTEGFQSVWGTQWESQGLPLVLGTKGWEGQGGFSLCVGHSGNPREFLSVYGTKRWEGQGDFSLCVGHSGNPRISSPSLGLRTGSLCETVGIPGTPSPSSGLRDGKDRGISVCAWDTVEIPGTPSPSLGLREGGFQSVCGTQWESQGLSLRPWD